MLLNKNTFNSLSVIKRLSLTIKTLSPEKSFYFFSAFIILILFIFICFNLYIKNNLTYTSPKYNQELNIQSSDKIKTYTPLFARTRIDYIVSNLLFAGLLKKEDNGSYVSDLAQNLQKSDDGLTINVTLRDDIYFSNGDPITTDDVIYTYEKIQDYNIDNPYRPRYEGLEFEKLDDKHFNIRVKKSYSQLEKALSLGIISKTEYTGVNVQNLAISDNNLTPITSGKYKVKTFNINDNVMTSLTLENNYYYHTLPYHKYINFYFTDLADSDFQKYFSSNDIDLSLDTNKNPTLDQEVYETIGYDTSITSTIYLNPSKIDILSKKQNREYLYKIIDREYLVKNILNGNATVTYDILPTSKNTYSQNQADISLTTFTKSSSTTNLTLSFLNTDNNQKIYSYLRDKMAGSNISLQSNPVDQDELQSIIKNRDFEMLLSGSDIEDISTLYSFLHSSQKNAPGLNITNYISKEFDKNTEILRYATNTITSNIAQEAMRSEFYSEYPYIPLYSKRSEIIKNKELNINISPYLERESDLLSDIQNSYTETERLYTLLQKYSEIIIKVNKIIHR